MLISPLACKLCAARGINPEQLRGTGPRGRIMAADVPATPPEEQRSGPRRALHLLHPTRAEKEGYCVYDDEVDMSALAGISLPIAVQCEKLLENRYSLFDYIVRAVVRACTAEPEWQPIGGTVNALIFERHGERAAAIPDAADKTIYRIARETAADSTVPEGYQPHIVVCDAQTTRAQVAAYLGPQARPDFAFVARGHSPKVGIRAGREQPLHCKLTYTFYAAAAAIPQPVANRIAATLRDFLFNPTRLLLIK